MASPSQKQARRLKVAKVFAVSGLVMTGLWTLLMIPSMLWWSNSIKWLVVISVYANISGSLAFWFAAWTLMAETDDE